jgi:hypothetical protein
MKTKLFSRRGTSSLYPYPLPLRPLRLFSFDKPLVCYYNTGLRKVQTWREHE